LIVVAIVVTALALACNVYVLVHFQHPDDRNQAWFPKIVVVTGLTLSVLSILLLPLDVANRAACDEAIIESACRYTLPMADFWYATYLTMFAYIFVLVPWTLFYYEQDSEATLGKKLVSSSIWSVATVFVLLMAMLLAYYVGGEAEFELKSVKSGMALIGNSALNGATSCIALPSSPTTVTNFATYTATMSGMDCDAYGPNVGTETFTVRPTFIVYMIAVASIISWFIFLVYAGVGIVALPVDMIKGFMNRPQKVIPKSEYIRCATILARDAQAIHQQIKNVQKEQRETGRTKKTKKDLKELQVKLSQLEDDEVELMTVFPQGEQREATWLMTVLAYYIQCFLGGLSVILSTLWTLHIIITVLVKPAAHPFLNSFFIWLDSGWSLLGTAAFALFCFYLVFCVIKGNTRLGLRFFFMKLYPMKLGRTSMSSLLFNTGLIMLGSISIVQFCAQVFNVYAAETAVTDIFGGNIENLKGLGYLFKYNVFIYSFFAMICLSCIIIPFETWKTPKPKKTWERDSGRI
jgi:LMBR1 domain-containing protein 1